VWLIATVYRLDALLCSDSTAAYELHADPGTDREEFCMRLMAALRQEFREKSAEIAHLKLHLKAGRSTLVANLTTSQGEPSVRGKIEASPGSARLLLNVRAHIGPGVLRELVDRVIAGAIRPSVRATMERIECFAPARPQPTHRYEAVV
jgi:hypothetical protein